MEIKKKILSILIIAAICLTSLLPAGASPDTAQEEMASTLARLSIISGSNGNFNLGRQLQKSEAIALIVKILGKEAYVKENSVYYSITGFPDVKSDDWFAPYVGFCVEEGIASGGTDGKFHPEEYISEKGFLLLTLRALGYSNETDFDMDTIFLFAYDTGLVTDPAYVDMTVDNKQYLKGDAIEVIFNALPLQINNDSRTVIQRMIESGAVTRDAALEEGIVVDGIKTAIEEITVLSSNRISIRFNEGIYNIKDSDIQIYESMMHSPYLTPLTIESYTGNEIIVGTPRQKPDVHYTVEVSNVYDSDGNPSDVLSSYFLGYEAPTVTSDYFKISRIEGVSRNTVNVFFTQPVNQNSEMPSYYEIVENGSTIFTGSSKTLTVKCLASYDNGVTLYFKDPGFSMNDSQTYSLKVSGNLTSLYGAKLNNGLGESSDFIAAGNEDEDLSVSGITPQDSKTIDVEFNKEIDYFYASQILNYSVMGPDGSIIPVSKAVPCGTGEKAGKTVRLTLLGTIEKTMQYELVIKYITDSVKQSVISESSYPFSGKYISWTDLAIRSLSAIDNATLLVRLNRQPSEASAVDVSNYLITGISDTDFSAIPVKVFYDPVADPRTVKLYLPAGKFLADGDSYRLRINKSIEDEFGNSPSRDLEASVFGIADSIIKPAITEAKMISNDSLKLTMSSEISPEAPNILTSNYSLEYREEGSTITRVPVFVGYIDPVTLILKFDMLNPAIQYTLKFTALKDYSGVNTRTLGDGQNSIAVTNGK